MHEVDLQRHAGDEAPRGEVPLPQLGAAIELDPKVVAALPVADVKEVRARTYARSLWGQTAKIEVRAADGVWSEYFLKVSGTCDGGRKGGAFWKAIRVVGLRVSGDYFTDG